MEIRQTDNRSYRMLSLFERLNKSEFINKSKEAEKFQVSEKTIQRDLDELRYYFSISNLKNDNHPIKL